MIDEFVIYVDRLTDGKVEEIDCALSSSFMDVYEQDLHFSKPISLKGTFYTTNDHLIGTLKIETSFEMPCSVCNEICSVPLSIQEYYITEPLENIPSGLYYPQEGIREAILLETPSFYECQDGNCPNRMALANTLSQIKNEKKEKDEKVNCFSPFKDL